MTLYIRLGFLCYRNEKNKKIDLCNVFGNSGVNKVVLVVSNVRIVFS